MHGSSPPSTTFPPSKHPTTTSHSAPKICMPSPSQASTIPAPSSSPSSSPHPNSQIHPLSFVHPCSHRPQPTWRMLLVSLPLRPRHPHDRPLRRQRSLHHLVLFRPSLASKPWLWLGLRRLRLSQTPGQAKAIKQGLAPAWPGLGRGFYM